jgi:TM2 domain-containing membrane protein YozV
LGITPFPATPNDMKKNQFSRLLFAIVNAVGFPGVGTLLAGRTRTGWIQITLSFLLMVSSAVPLMALFIELYSRGLYFERLVDIIMLRDTWIFSQRELGLLTIAVSAVLAYLANLLWSLTTTRPVHPTAPPPLP